MAQSRGAAPAPTRSVSCSTRRARAPWRPEQARAIAAGAAAVRHRRGALRESRRRRRARDPRARAARDAPVPRRRAAGVLRPVRAALDARRPGRAGGRFARMRSVVSRARRPCCSMRRCPASSGAPAPRSTGPSSRARSAGPWCSRGGWTRATWVGAIRAVRPWAVDVSSGVEVRARREGCGPDRGIREECERCRCARRRLNPGPPRPTTCPTRPAISALTAASSWPRRSRRPSASCARPTRRAARIPRSRPSSPTSSSTTSGRPSPVYHAKRLSDELGGAQIYLKREDLNHTGAHKVNNTMGQALRRPPHGQAARDRRDRRRPARRGHGHRGRALRHEVRGVHGHRGRRAPGAERLPHEAAGRHRGAGLERLAHPQGRAQRGDARLGHQRRRHVLHHRHRRRPASRTR